MEVKLRKRPAFRVAWLPDSSTGASEQHMSLSLLGGFELRIGDRIQVVSRPAERLLVFLALQHRRLTRSYVSQSLWLDATESHADGSLRYVLCKIGKIEPTLIDKMSGHLALGALVSVDFHRSSSFARTLVNDPESMDGAELDERMLYADLLPDWQEEWILQHQEQYRQLRLHALESLCERLISLGRFGRAIQAGLAAVAGEPLRERANLALVRAYLADGNASEGIRHYRSFVRKLDEEIGQRPSPAFGQALESLGGR